MPNDPKSTDASPEDLRPEDVRPEDVKPAPDTLVPEATGIAPESEPGVPNDIKERRAREQADPDKGDKPHGTP